MELFAVAGVAIRHSYDFADATVPGGVRRVLGKYASARQMQGDNRVSADDVAAVVARVGDLDARLWDRRDIEHPRA